MPMSLSKPELCTHQAGNTHLAGTTPATTISSTTVCGLMTVSRLLEILLNYESQCQDITWSEGFADGSSDNGKGVLAGNWNAEALLYRSCRADTNLQQAKYLVNQLARYLYGGTSSIWHGRPMPKGPSLFPNLTREALRIAREAEREALQPWEDKAKRIGDILERAGYSLEWSDTGCACGGCSKWIATVPMDFCFRPDYLVTDDIYCGECVRDEIGSHLDDFLDQADGPIALEECRFGQNLDLTKTWAAIEALDDEDLTFCLADQALLDALRTHRWPAIHHDNQVVFRTPEPDEPVSIAMEALLGEEL